MIIVTPGKSMRGNLGKHNRFQIPGDKSISHRAALLGAMTLGDCVYSNFLVSGVTRVILNALSGIGVTWELAGSSLQISGIGIRGIKNSQMADREKVHIDCGNSATSMRLLAGALPAMGITAVLDGSTGLRKRPMSRIVDPLTGMGVRISDTDGCAPLSIDLSEYPLKALNYKIPIASAQVKSCLLLAALAADGVTELIEPGPSRDHTERMLLGMGINVEKELRDRKEQVDGTQCKEYITRIQPSGNTALNPISMSIPGDVSAAAFLIIAVLICPESEVKICGVGINPTRTGILDALIEMGADISKENEKEIGGEPAADICIKSSTLRGVRISGSTVVRMIDEFPIFAVAASFADGTTDISDASELRYKETDRISSLCKELTKIGVDVTEKQDGFRIQGRRPYGGTTIDPHGDHRLAMAFTIAGLASQNPIRVKNPEIMQESFPEFLPILIEFGADITKAD